MFDMEALALASGSVISASLFGALAGSGALPFPRAAFEAAIRRLGQGGRRVAAGLCGGLRRGRAGEPQPATAAPAATAPSPRWRRRA